MVGFTKCREMGKTMPSPFEETIVQISKISLYNIEFLMYTRIAGRFPPMAQLVERVYNFMMVVYLSLIHI